MVRVVLTTRVDDDETASQELTVEVSAKGNDAMEGGCDEEFAKPVENNNGDIASKVVTVEVIAEGNYIVEGDGEKYFTARALVRK